MGLLNSKDEWAEVYNNGSPGSPDSNDVPVQQEKGGKKKKFLRSIDPRSISDDVERTPIQAGSAARSPTDDQCATPIMATAKKNPTDRFKAAMDPRSPSGLPRTPILIQDDVAASTKEEDPETPAAPGPTDTAENVPKRGAMVAKKLEMEEEHTGEIVEVEKTEENKAEIVVDDVDETENSVDETNSLPSGTGKSLPRMQDLKIEPSDCRSPLLIESSSPTEAKTSSHSKKSRIPLRVKQQQHDSNARENLATRMMKEVTISDEQNSSCVEAENSENSLII